MMKFNKYLLATLISFCFLPVLLWASEPANLDLAKQTVVTYYQSGAYQRDVQKVTESAKAYLVSRLAQNKDPSKKMAIVFDVDDTMICRFGLNKADDFNDTSEAIMKRLNLSDTASGESMDTVNAGVLDLFNFAKAHHIAIFIVTGRTESFRNSVSDELQHFGYNGWTALRLRSDDEKPWTASQYKTKARKEIVAQGYDILLTIGDQYSDLKGGYADKGFKLPNPMYYLP